MRLFYVLVVSLFTFLGHASVVRAGLIEEIYQLTDRKQYGAALERLNQFLQSHPDDAQARFLKGLVLTERGQQDEAIAIFLKLSTDYPDLPEPYNNLAVLYAEKGQYKQALDALELAIKAHPTYATAHENMGDIYAKMASQSYRKALSLDNASDVVKGKLNHINSVFVAHGLPPASVPDGERVAESEKLPAPKQWDKPKESELPKPIRTSSPSADKVPREEIDSAVKAWLDAWSSLDVERYLQSYSPKFRPPAKFPNYQAWVQNRRRVIGSAKKVRVTYSNLRVRMLAENLARAEFRQSYWSPSYSDQVNKTLTLAREGGRWVITWERSGE